MKVGIIDYGIGNLRSIQKGFEYFGVTAIVSPDAAELNQCEKLVLPGVGAFSHCKTELTARFGNFMTLIANRPTLGICVGMQLMFEYSLEFGRTDGLGVIEGAVEHILTKQHPIPHTGWNSVCRTATGDNMLFHSISDNEFFYFNHSFTCHPNSENAAIATTEYGQKFVCAVNQDNFYGVQFHPEKSGKVGLKLLKNFYDYC